MRVAVIDSETTGLRHGVDELICLAIRVLEVERFGGRVVREAGSYLGRHEPRGEMSPEAQLITGLSKASLQGQRFNAREIEVLLEQCELVVSHNAAFDRPFVEDALSRFAELPWACSLSEIDWRGKEQQPKASLDHLLSVHGWQSKGTVEDDCLSLARLLAMPLPVTPWNGYVQLIDASEAAEHHLWLPDPGLDYHWTLAARGYRLDEGSRSLWKHFDDADLDAELDKLRDCLSGSGVHRLHCMRIDSRRRFSARDPEAIEIELRC
jgi:DNA polymerase-3 subunit epsilon